MVKKLFAFLIISLSVFAAKSPRINGFFIQPVLGYGVADYTGKFGTQEYYDNWVKSMADIGATMLFYQWTGHYEENQGWYSNAYGGAASADFFYYETNLTPLNGIPVQTWMHGIETWTGERVSPVKRVLDAGEKHGVKIWLGLYLSEKGQFNWWNAVNSNNISASDSATFRHHVERSVQMVQDLPFDYLAHSALGGFYYPIEIANLGFEKEENWDMLVWLLDSVAIEVSKQTGKRLAISPFFNTRLTPAEEWGRMWNYVLGRMPFENNRNIVMILQDGVGVEPHILTESTDLISPYFRAVRDACLNNGIPFWANVELFTNTSGDRANMQMTPSSIEKILLQKNTLAEFADTFVNFSFMSLDPFVENVGFSGFPLSARQKLYNDYKAYYQNIPTAIGAAQRPKTALKNYQVSVSGNRISFPKFDSPVSYSLVSPSGRVVLSGISEGGKTITSPTAAGIYILMLNIGTQTPMKQKIFIQN